MPPNHTYGTYRTYVVCVRASPVQSWAQVSVFTPPLGTPNLPLCGFVEYTGHALVKKGYLIKDIFTILLDFNVGSMGSTRRNHTSRMGHISSFFVTGNFPKCSFFIDEVEFLGHMVSTKGITACRKYIGRVLQFAHPTTRPELKRYMGCIGWLTKYILNLKEICAPISRLAKQNVPFIWTDADTEIFVQIQNLVDKCNILAHPDWDKEFFIWTDASDIAYGAVLMQMQDNGEYAPIEFMSRQFSDTEKRWHITSKELFSVLQAVKKWDKYLYRKFTIHTDAKNIVHLFNQTTKNKTNNYKHYRWYYQLSCKNFDLIHVSGIENVIADYLSRSIDYRKCKEIEEGKNQIIPPKTKNVLIPTESLPMNDTARITATTKANLMQMKTSMSNADDTKKHHIMYHIKSKCDKWQQVMQNYDMDNKIDYTFTISERKKL